MSEKAGSAERPRAVPGAADHPAPAPDEPGTTAAVPGLAAPGRAAVADAPARAAVPSVGPQADIPLTEAQAGIWYAQRVDPGNPVFNTAQVVEIEGPLDLEAFAAAVEQACAEADTLAVRVIEGLDGAAQVVDEELRPRLETIDLREEPRPRSADHSDPESVRSVAAEGEGVRTLPSGPLRSGERGDPAEADAASAPPPGSGSASDARLRAEAAIQLDLRTPIDPAVGPLAAQKLFRLRDDLHLWYQRIHHLAVDGYGTSLLTRRIRDLYAARAQDRELEVSAFRPYAHLLEEDAAYRASAKREADRTFWLSRFADRPDVGALKPGTGSSADRYLRASAALSPTLLPALQRLGEDSGTAWPDVLAALVIAYLHRFTPAHEIVTGVAAMNRLGSAAARIPAMAMNVLPLRTAVDEAEPLRDHVARVGDALRAARRHGRYRGEQLRRDLGLLGEGRRMYGALVNILPYEEPVHLPGLSSRLRTLATGPVDDLTIEVRGGGTGAGDGLRLEVQANPSMYPPAEVAGHAERLASFLDRAVAADRLVSVPTVTPAEHDRWIALVNATDRAVEETTLSHLLERAVKAAPDRPALRFQGATLTYAELDRLTAARARMLAGEGIGRGDVVAVALPRSFDLVLSLVAILRAGAAYLPLDLRSPAERIRRILASAQPKKVWTTAAHRGLFPDGFPVDLTDQAPARLAEREPQPPTPEDAAYVIYTSGSTGEPKGVVVEHGAIVNRLLWMQAEYGIGPGDRILQKTPATFDVSVWEFFLALISGGTLVVAPPEAHRDPVRLATILRTERITTVHFVPSMLAAFLEEPAAAQCGVRRIFCSGEALSAPLRDRCHEVVDAELHNLYGPTEAAVDVTYWDASAGDESDPVPIGRPVWNTRMYVLDDRMRPVPAGVVGHLYIGGVQLARGYLARPDLTAERFLPDPFHPAPARIYRTGDLAEWREDGVLLFHGRSDFQVKIRGFRIELGEIEAVLLGIDGVRQAVVVARDLAGAGDPRLVAYLVPAEGTALEPDGLRNALAARLPEYMVPAAFVLLAELPLTSSGKLDRSALPDPEPAAERSGRAAGSPTERALARLFREVLKVEEVGVDDDFFLIGGHSLLAARLALRIREGWGREVGIGAVFAHPTVARLARHLDAAGGDGTAAAGESGDDGLGPLIRLRVAEGTRGAREGAVPLHCIHPAGGISWCYRALASALPEGRDVFGLQAVGLDPDRSLPDTLEAMARDYVERILRQQPDGPYHLVGWSVGGIIAQAMAVELQAADREVRLLAMLDAYPSDCWRGEPEPDEGAALAALLQIAGHGESGTWDGPLTRARVLAMLRRLGHPLGELSDRSLTGVVRVVEQNARLVRAHRHRKFDGPLLHFRAARDHEGTDLRPELWTPYVGSMEIVEIDAYHPQMIRGEAVAETARVIASRLSER